MNGTFQDLDGFTWTFKTIDELNSKIKNSKHLGTTFVLVNNIDYNQIDVKCKDMVKFFNGIGLDTKFSCQGHDNGLNNDYMIMFQDYITDYDIKDFIIKFKNQYSHSPFLGKFTKWMRKINGEIQCNWQYTVDTGKYLSNQNRANEDLKTFQQIYNK